MSRLDYILQDPFSTQADVDEYCGVDDGDDEAKDENLSDDVFDDESDDICVCGMYH